MSIQSASPKRPGTRFLDNLRAASAPVVYDRVIGSTRPRPLNKGQYQIKPDGSVVISCRDCGFYGKAEAAFETRVSCDQCMTEHKAILRAFDWKDPSHVWWRRLWSWLRGGSK